MSFENLSDTANLALSFMRKTLTDDNNVVNVVVGPVLAPDTDGKPHLIIGFTGAEIADCPRGYVLVFKTDLIVKPDNIDHATFRREVIEVFSEGIIPEMVVHDVNDLRRMARLCVKLWPGERSLAWQKKVESELKVDA